MNHNNNLVDGTSKNVSDALTATMTNPYPQFVGYTTLWNSLDDKGRKHLVENIAMSADGKIDLLKLGMKASVFQSMLKIALIETAVQSIQGDYEDNAGNRGLEGVTYSSLGSLNHMVLKPTERDAFIAAFPGDYTEDKRSAIVTLLELGETGYFDTKEDNRKEVKEKGRLIICGAPDGARSQDPQAIKWSREMDADESDLPQEVGDLAHRIPDKGVLAATVGQVNPAYFAPVLVIERKKSQEAQA